jgi:GT2 family glycosyltransferase
MHQVYILLPVHNRKEITRGFVECLKKQSCKNYQLILIDDGSTDGTADMVKEAIPSTVVIQGDGTWWWAGSLQRGIDWLLVKKTSPDDIVLMINDDVEMGVDFIGNGCKELLQLPYTLLQAKIYCNQSHELIDNGMIFDATKLQFRPPKSGECINCLTTNGLFLRWGDLLKVGNFYPRLLPHYLSDYEFTIRAWKKGMKLVVSEGAIIYWNRETTAPRNFNQQTFLLFLKSYFSKRSPTNPLYWTFFLLLTNPLRNIPMNLLRVWKNATLLMLYQLRASLKSKLLKKITKG